MFEFLKAANLFSSVTVRTRTEKIISENSVIFVISFVKITEDDPNDEDEVERRRQNGSVVELLRQQHKQTLVVRLAVFGDALYKATFTQTQISSSYDATKYVTVNSYGFGSLLTYLCIHSRVWKTDSDQLLVSSVLRPSRYIFWSPRTQASQATGGAVACIVAKFVRTERMPFLIEFVAGCPG